MIAAPATRSWRIPGLQAQSRVRSNWRWPVYCRISTDGVAVVCATEGKRGRRLDVRPVLPSHQELHLNDRQQCSFPWKESFQIHDAEEMMRVLIS